MKKLLLSLEARLIYWLLSCVFTGCVLGTVLTTGDERMRVRRTTTMRSSRASIRYIQMKRRGGA